MPTKNIAHDAQITTHQPNYHTRELLIVAGILFVIGLAVAVLTIQSRNSNAARSSSFVETVPYSDALALEYAQPYLEAEVGTSGATTTFSNALAMQYAQPYLKPAAVAEYSDALAMQYAQPYLDAVGASVPFSDALALQYARPWMEAQAPNCNGRLDEMYACQNSR